MEMQSTPAFSADRPCRTEVHLWITLTPAALNFGKYGTGLRPAVSTILMPEPTMASI
jgi:hypothetical protein